MGLSSLECKHVDGSVVIKINGIFKISTLYCLALLAWRYSEQSTKLIVVDVSGELTISSEVRRLKGRAADLSATGMAIAIVGQKKNTKVLKNILSRHIG